MYRYTYIRNLCDCSCLIYIMHRKYSSFSLNLLFINLQGCAVKMGLCQGEDHSTARPVTEFVLFEETFASFA